MSGTSFTSYLCSLALPPIECTDFCIPIQHHGAAAHSGHGQIAWHEATAIANHLIRSIFHANTLSTPTLYPRLTLAKLSVPVRGSWTSPDQDCF